ncbi:MAG: hypothetical protein AAF449_20830, partial [Myxococcota bacterium]
MIITARKGLKDVEYFSCRDRIARLTSPDELTLNRDYAITHLSTLLPQVFDAVGADISDPERDNPLYRETGNGVLLFIGQRNGRHSILKFLPTADQRSELCHMAKLDHGDWIRAAFLVPRRVLKGSKETPDHSIVYVTTRGSVYELDVDELYRSNDGYLAEPQCLGRFPSSPNAVEMYRKRHRSNYSLVAAAPDGLWLFRPMERPYLIQETIGRDEYLSLAKCQTYDQNYLLAGSASGKIYGYRLNPPEHDVLFQAPTFQLKVPDRPITLAFLRWCSNPDQQRRERRMQQQVYFLVGGDAELAYPFRVREKWESQQRAQTLFGIASMQNDPVVRLAELARIIDEKRPANPTQRRFILRVELPSVLDSALDIRARRHTKEDGHRDILVNQDKRDLFSSPAALVITNIIASCEKRTAVAAIRLLVRYSSLFAADDLIELSARLIESIGPVDERLGTVQRSRESLERLLKAIISDGCDRSTRTPEERTKLAAWGSFLTTFVAGGYTYSSKRNNLLKLARTNASAGHRLDA